MLQEASELSSLKSQLDAHGVQLYAVVQETLGVKQFQPYFKGEILLDEKVLVVPISFSPEKLNINAI